MNIISLTTLPSRISKFNKALKRIKKQCLDDDKIIVWLPDEFKRMGRKNDWSKLERLEGVEYRLCEDLGPITKIYYTLQEYMGKDINIICADDDGLYNSKWLDGLLKYSEIYPQHCIGYVGRVFGDSLDYNKSLKYSSEKIKKHFEVDLLLGVGGVLYKPNMFKEDFFKKFSPKDHMFFTDDIWIMGNLAKNGVRRMMIPSRRKPFTPLNVCAYDALWDINRFNNNNDESIKYFQEYW